MVDCFGFLSWPFRIIKPSSTTRNEITTSLYHDEYLFHNLLDNNITETSSYDYDDVDDDLFTKLPKNVISLYILKKLPAKDLFQLMQVSKLFRSLITKPDFLNLHISSLNPTQDHLLFHKYIPHKRFYFCYHNSSTSSFSSSNSVGITFESDCFSGCLKVVGSTRGVVFFWYRDSVSNSPEVLCLWNPLIGELKRLPPAPPSWIPIQLVFGFGFDEVTVDFKVVKIVYQDWDCIDQAEAFVYARKMKSWRSVGNVVPCIADLSNFDCCNSVSVNGVVYWLAYKQQLGYYNTVQRPNCIMGFDLVEEAFNVVKLPLDILKHGKELRLTKWLDGESLALFVRKNSQGRYSTWSMFVANVVCDSKTVLSWEKKFTLVMPSYFLPQWLVNSRQIMATVMTVNRIKELVLYDVEEEKMKCLGDGSLLSFSYITDYTPSLALLDSYCPLERLLGA